MKQGQGSKRTRGRSGGGRRGPNRQQMFDSNGPSVRIRGNAFQVYEKYLTLARDASSAGDRVAAENYFQHAEHYFRIYSADQEELARRQPANGQAPDGQRRHQNNGADRNQQHTQNPGNGGGQSDRHDGNGTNGANGANRGNGANGAETNVAESEPAVTLESEIDLTAADSEAPAEATVSADAGESRPAPARRPRRRKPAPSE